MAVCLQWTGAVAGCDGLLGGGAPRLGLCAFEVSQDVRAGFGYEGPDRAHQNDASPWLTYDSFCQENYPAPKRYLAVKRYR